MHKKRGINKYSVPLFCPVIYIHALQCIFHVLGAPKPLICFAWLSYSNIKYSLCCLVLWGVANTQKKFWFTMHGDNGYTTVVSSKSLPVEKRWQQSKEQCPCFHIKHLTIQTESGCIGHSDVNLSFFVIYIWFKFLYYYSFITFRLQA